MYKKVMYRVQQGYLPQGTASVDEDAIARHEPGQYSLVVDLSSVIMGDPT